MRRRRAVRLEPVEEFNLMPLLDVVFIILIFFVVTASFVKDTGVKVSRPSAHSAEPQDQTPIQIAITAQGQIWIANQTVSLSALGAQVERLHAQNPQGAVLIQADRNATTGLLVTVLDQVRRVGIADIAIAAERRAD